ncbi:hypothetical protein Rsub_00857 [Raphidocelis subcapitata]|uniref:Uncharacterized protein n=1 Tax=Raphidocelis subcapitata TaxID=307507 RepID=A0A2V0NTI7_9CHLO|nr:hypothetical protein Rsub_00857 [Raphidocelis subcapitata]|eukprot:GBF88145.1 hypothetical protein Rsub_00857 [Raphidocelis subcapitata]
MARPAAAAAALLMLAGLAALAAAESDRFSLPIMSKFDELDTDVLKVRMEQASVLWKTETASNGNCVVPTSPCSGNLLTSWFEAANAAERSWLTMAMIKDAYPKPGNLGVQGDGPDYECKMRGKWSALGADRVAFVNTELTNIVLMKAGRSVFVSYRGTWTDAQANNNRHECASTSDCGGPGGKWEGGRVRFG